MQTRGPDAVNRDPERVEDYDATLLHVMIGTLNVVLFILTFYYHLQQVHILYNQKLIIIKDLVSCF